MVHFTLALALTKGRHERKRSGNFGVGERILRFIFSTQTQVAMIWGTGPKEPESLGLTAGREQTGSSSLWGREDRPFCSVVIAKSLTWPGSLRPAPLRILSHHFSQA